MTKWRADFHPRFQKELDGYEDRVAKDVITKIDWLADNCDDLRHQALGEPLGHYFKLRVGDLRVAYKLDYRNLFVKVEAVGPRDKIYKMLLR